MFSKRLHGKTVLLLAVAFSNALTIPTGGTLGDTPAPLINITLPQRLNPAASLEDFQINCRGSQYGTGLRYSSCLDAFRTFSHGQAVNPVQIRRRGPGEAAHKLPWMWVSGTRRHYPTPR